MQGELTCPQCSQEYDSENLPRLLTMCGHTYCQMCITSMITQQGNRKYKVVCPDDGASTVLKDKSVSSFPKNIALVKILQGKKNNSFKDSSFDVSKITKQQQILQEDDETSELITAIKDCQKNSPQNQKETFNLCLLHQKPLEVVCMIDLQKICAKCAIFGQHKGHQFKSLEEIDRETNEYYGSIIKIFQKKDTIAQRLSNKDTENQILNILNNKKSKMKKQINEKYKKLIDNIKLSQKQSLHRLDLTIQSTQKNLKELLQLNPQIMQQYSRWEEQSFQQIQIIENGTFEKKLQQVFLRQKRSLEAGLLETGNSIIEDMIKQQDNLVNDVQIVLKNIGLQFNHEIMQIISDFCTIYQDGNVDGSDQYQEHEDYYQQNRNMMVHNHNEESLLDADTDNNNNTRRSKNFKFDAPKMKNFQPQPRVSIYTQKRAQEPYKVIPKSQEKQLKVYNNTRNDRSPEQSFMSDKNDRLSKKKLKSIKVPEKYQKVLDNIYNDSLDVIDFTNAELGNAIILQISDFIRGTKAKTVKLIRNKLTDDVIAKIVPNLGNVITLNLSQNLLTDSTIDIIINYRDMLPNLKSIILSQNKIIQRKHKIKIDKLRKMELTVSV